MKEEIFNVYLKKVLQQFKLTKDEFFTKSKRRDLVEARYMLYYLCSNRPIRLCFIEEYMGHNDYFVDHANIIHGIKVMKKKIKEDTDYIKVIREIERCVA